VRTRSSLKMLRRLHGRLRAQRSKVVMPACGPVAQVRDPPLVKPVFCEVFVSEDADPGEMVPDRLELNRESRMASPTR
jgi:hypothetical protein